MLASKKVKWSYDKVRNNKTILTILSFIRILYLKQQCNILRCLCSLKFGKSLFSNQFFSFKPLSKMMMMMNCFCGVVDRRKEFSLISSRDHCLRFWPSRISDTPGAGFEPAQNLSSGLVVWSCAVVIIITPRRHVITITTYFAQNHILLCANCYSMFLLLP